MNLGLRKVEPFASENSGAMMRFTVVVPAFNSEKFMADCLDSLLSQSHPDWECIVVDVGSSDSTPVIVQRYAEADHRIRLLSQANQGPGVARNLGVRSASHPWIAFLDSDDRFLPTTLARYNRVIEEVCLPTQDVRVLCGHFCPQLNQVRTCEDVEVLDLFLSNTYIGYRASLLPSASAIAKECFQEIGYFSSQGELGVDGTGEDLDFWARATARYRVAEIKSTVTLYRQDDANSRNERMKATGRIIDVHRGVLERNREHPLFLERFAADSALSIEFGRRYAIADFILQAASWLAQGNVSGAAPLYERARAACDKQEYKYLLHLLESLLCYPQNDRELLTRRHAHLLSGVAHHVSPTNGWMARELRESASDMCFRQAYAFVDDRNFIAAIRLAVRGLQCDLSPKTLKSFSRTVLRLIASFLKAG